MERDSQIFSSAEFRLRDGRALPPSSDPGREEDKPVDLGRYVRLLWRNKFLILFCVLVAGGMAAFQLRRASPVYSTTAIIKFEPQGAQVVDFGERSSLLYQRDEIRTAVELVRSPKVAERVLAALGTKPPAPVVDQSPVSVSTRALRTALQEARQLLVSYDPPKYDEQTMRGQMEIENLLGGLRVTQRGETKLIAVTYSGRNPAETARIANEFAKQYILYLNDDRVQAISYARTFLDEQVESAKKRLMESENNLYQYSQTSDLRVMDENLTVAIGNMKALNTEIETMRNQIADLEARNRALSEGLVKPTIFSEDAVISTLMKRMVDLEIERLSQEAINVEQNPEVQRIRREIASIDAKVKELSAQMGESTNAELLMAKYRLEAFENRLSEQKEEVDQINGQMIEFTLLQRDVDSANLMYTTLLDQFKRIQVKDDINPSNVTIVAPAPVPSVPSSPKVTRTLVTFMMVGLALGVGLAFLLGWMDRSVKDPAVVEEKLGLATLGFVPFIRRKGLLRLKAASRKSPALVDLDSKSHNAEAFHYLRASLQYSSADHPPQVMLVTSCMPQEGKSTVSSNLAFFYAQAGGRTLLIDADLKRPAVHKAFNIVRSPGLSDVLTGQVELEKAIIVTGNASLSILPAGNNSPSPINLLDSRAMTDLIAGLRKEYDTIIIDSAPAHAMADSLVLCTRVDGVCLVVKRGNTHYDVLEQTAAKIRSLKGNMLGVIYNSGKERISEKAYGYGTSYVYTYKSHA